MIPRNVIRYLLILDLFVIIGFLIIYFSLSFNKQPTQQNSCKNITQESAIASVTSIPEVNTWIQEMESNNQKTTIIASQDATKFIYNIQIAEVLPDHLATYNWYEVNYCTGEVKRVF